MIVEIIPHERGWAIVIEGGGEAIYPTYNIAVEVLRRRRLSSPDGEAGEQRRFRPPRGPFHAGPLPVLAAPEKRPVSCRDAVR